MNTVSTHRSRRHFLQLLISMTEKELVVRYKNTLLGFLWVIINPLIQMLVIGFVFRFFIKEPIEHYYSYLFSGLLIWNFFSLSLTKATPSIVYERSLIKKAIFPHAVIPLSIVFANFVNLLVSLALFLPVVIIENTFTINHLPAFILGMLLLLLFTCGLTLFTSALNVRFRDVSFFVQAILSVWFYATPIVYSIYVIPYDFMWLWRINPMTSLIQLFQHSLVSFPAPGIAMFTLNTIVIVAICIIGVVFFHLNSKYFDDWL